MTTTNTTALTVHPSGTFSYLPTVSPDAIEQALTIGDLAQMAPATRVAYYLASCQSMGLNPLTRPFDALKGMDGKYRLYPNAQAAEQLRKKYRISIKVVERHHDRESGLYTVTVQATTPDGREEESQGILDVHGLKGQPLGNAMMKCETKAKRRVTMALCGLGYESEPVSAPAQFDPHSGAMEGPSLLAETTPHEADDLETLVSDLYGDPRDVPNFGRSGPAPTDEPDPEEKPTTADPGARGEHGGSTFLAQIEAAWEAQGMDEAQTMAAWTAVCVRYGVRKPRDLKMSVLPGLLAQARAGALPEQGAGEAQDAEVEEEDIPF